MDGTCLLALSLGTLDLATQLALNEKLRHSDVLTSQHSNEVTEKVCGPFRQRGQVGTGEGSELNETQYGQHGWHLLIIK